jgi:hypothetical protein
MLRTYRGSCHCKAVRFEVDLDLARGTSRCNCSICGKTRFWKAIAEGNAFRLLQGEDALTEYRFGDRLIGHFFCRTCGVKIFGLGETEHVGCFHAINIACLEASDAELAAAPVFFENGRENRWDEEPPETRHL